MSTKVTKSKSKSRLFDIDLESKKFYPPNKEAKIASSVSLYYPRRVRSVRGNGGPFDFVYSPLAN